MAGCFCSLATPVDPGSQEGRDHGGAREFVGATSVKLTVVVPHGATSGNLVVSTAQASSSAPIPINQFLSGSFNPGVQEP